MKIVDIKDNYDRVLDETVEVLAMGGMVIYPTDTVYILAVDPTNKAAVDKLLGFKNRWAGKAISVAVNGKKMAEEYVVLSETAMGIYQNLLPGPFTIISEGRHKMAPGIEAEDGSLGIRIPDNKYMIDLAKKFGRPITATSANLSGRTPHYSIGSFLKTLSQKKRGTIDLIVDGGKLPNNKPSTVIDARTPEVKVLRRGDLISSGATRLVSKSPKETGKIAEFLLSKSLSAFNPPPTTQNPNPSFPLTGQGVTRVDKPIVFGLSGDLGTGKTVFSKKIGKLLGVEGIINSPTFTIYNEYKPLSPLPLTRESVTHVIKFLHFDLYRLSGKHEFEELKFLELFAENTVSCVEWPENMGKENFEKLKNMTRYVAVNFEYVDGETREISYEIRRI